MHFSTLLIEPPGIDSQLLQLMLAPEKFRVETAEWGPDAWNLILQTMPPDLVIVDTDLPLSGTLRIGASQQLTLMADRPQWRNTAKLVLTSDPSTSILQTAKAAGVSSMIRKPYDPRRFMQAIYESLSHILEVHIKEINRQHLQLGNQLAELIKSCKSGDTLAAKKKLMRLPNAIDAHFVFEEGFMARHNYPDLIKHHHGHRELMAKTEAVIGELCSSDSDIDVTRLELLNKELFVGVDDDKKYIDFLYDLIDSLMGQR